MGLIRILLAIAVIIDHAGPIMDFRLVTGAMAVEAFFMISGFYMALVLNEKYIAQNASYKLFISQRLLRLYPIYWLVLGLTVLASVLLYWTQGYPMKLEAYYAAPKLALSSWLVLIETNLFIIGQDTLLFLGLNNETGGLYWTNTFLTSKPPVFEFVFVHQAWSLSIEIAFYVIAPFIMRRRPIVLALLAAISIGLRVYLYRIGLDNDPWNYRFFPCELAFFFVGGLAYHGYRWLKDKQVPLVLLRACLASVILATLVYQFMPAIPEVKLIYYIIFAFTLPFNFILTKKNHLDYKIGELSYPIYISHLLVLLLMLFVASKIHIGKSLLTLIVVGLTIILSVLLVRFVADPIERIRQRRVSKRGSILQAP